STRVCSAFFVFFFFFFFFQAEDGIRHRNVTGVQTCALPISAPPSGRRRQPAGAPRSRQRGRRPRLPRALAPRRGRPDQADGPHPLSRVSLGTSMRSRPRLQRSEERRVGKEGRGRGG